MKRYHGKKTRKRGGDPDINTSYISNSEYNDIVIKKRSQINKLLNNHSKLSANEKKKQDKMIDEKIGELLASIKKLREERTGITSLQNRKKELQALIDLKTAKIDEIKSRIGGIKESTKRSTGATDITIRQNNSALQKQLLNEIARLESNSNIIEYNAFIKELEEIEKKLHAIELNNTRRRNLYSVKKQLDGERAALRYRKNNPGLLNRFRSLFKPF